MKIFVTGATGFAGSHTAAELIRAGHSVRLLARRPQALHRHFQRLGLRADDVVQGDMTDAAAMRRAMQGCDAVLHAAAVVNLDPRQAAATYRINMDGVQAVVGGACELGIENIVYVCSLSALANTSAELITEDTRPDPPANPYARSKQDADAWVRGLQQQGQAVQISYPSAILGPDDPALCESNSGLIAFASQVVPVTSSGFQAVDVRDLAIAHRFLLEHPPVANHARARYIIGGNYYPWEELHQLLEQVTGRRVRRMSVPGSVFRFLGRSLDILRRVVPFSSKLTFESAELMTRWVPASSERYLQHSGNSFRSGAQTMGDALASLAAYGYMPAAFAGKKRLVQNTQHRSALHDSASHQSSTAEENMH